jgi:hypothetical protein
VFYCISENNLIEFYINGLNFFRKDPYAHKNKTRYLNKFFLSGVKRDIEYLLELPYPP